MELSVRIREESKEDESMCDTPLRKGEDLNLTIGKVYFKEEKMASRESLIAIQSMPKLNMESSKNLSGQYS